MRCRLLTLVVLAALLQLASLPSASARPRPLHVVVVGGNGAGVAAARQVRRRHPRARITILEGGGDVSYGKCPMPYRLAKGRSLETLVHKSAQSLREHDRIDVRTHHLVTRLDARDRRVSGTNGKGDFSLSYDKLIIATGTKPNAPPIDGLSALWGKGVHQLHSLQDARALKSALHKQIGRRPRSAVVIGAGFVGLESAEQLAKQGLKVTLMQRGELLPALPQRMRARVLEQAKRAGVDLQIGTDVSKVRKLPTGALRVTSNRGQVDGDVVLMATGAKPNAALAKAAGLKLSVNGTIAVDAQMRTSHPDIFAAGDVADAQHAVTNGRTWVPLALNANRGGRTAGDNVLATQPRLLGRLGARLGRSGRPETESASPVAGTSIFRFYNLEVARAGLTLAEAKQAGYRAVEKVVAISPRLTVSLVADAKSHKLLGGAMLGDGRNLADRAAHRIDALAVLLHSGARVADVKAALGGTPLHTVASALAPKLSRRARAERTRDRRSPADWTARVTRSGTTETASAGLTVEQARRRGFAPVEVKTTIGRSMTVTLLADRTSRALLGGTISGDTGKSTHNAAHRIDALSALLYSRATVDALLRVDFAFAPPFGPSRSPLAQAAIALKKQLAAR